MRCVSPFISATSHFTDLILHFFFAVRTGLALQQSLLITFRQVPFSPLVHHGVCVAHKSVSRLWFYILLLLFRPLPPLCSALIRDRPLSVSVRGHLMSVIPPDNGRPALYHAPCSLWSMRTSLSSPCAFNRERCVNVNRGIWYHFFFFFVWEFPSCGVWDFITLYFFCSSHFVSHLIKFPLVISTSLAHCPFIQ